MLEPFTSTFLHHVVAIMILLILPLSTGAVEQKCQPSTAVWQSMASGDVSINTGAGELLKIPVRVADNESKILGGFQSLCADAVGSTAILFIFKRPFKGKFHMQNVYLPLETFFFSDQGALLKVEHMLPEAGSIRQRQTYGPDEAFLYVLEIPSSEFSRKLGQQDSLFLKELDVTSLPPQ
ncbi:MAG TPA: hypothetical protein DD827_07920 [Gammaproteobacteria bacterium]|jgi:uncharacterized membrane protein (UPF0127 family)|nr:hypothetical protein [Gammaproteobacteria bacterium]